MKKIIVPAFILMLGFIISAFSIDNPKEQVSKNFTDQYWHFTGNSGQQNMPSLYEPIDDPDEPDCLGSGVRCVILAPPSSGNPSQPDLSGTVTVIHEKG